MEIKLTVLFKDSFWIGIFEENVDGNYSACKYLFGSEPKDYEIYDIISREFYNLNFSRHMKDTKKSSDASKKISPKRMQRLIKKEINDVGIGTKAQRAINAERESNKVQRKKLSKDRKEELKKVKYDKKQLKKKQKKRGH
ncbi:YjdF family protein [Vallitalea guaymasensis]|uniref:YjdF family protein n=1 Tax=Vallitalea guaymasensis TaxID=1185412 RepID=A0A8J8SEE9_9FIRM|nr:YjdF family protein [Vallitalea guaymasensis]QUH31807.1 YjdF family protein [Vallitalea guaymasensis]